MTLTRLHHNYSRILALHGEYVWHYNKHVTADIWGGDSDDDKVVLDIVIHNTKTKRRLDLGLTEDEIRVVWIDEHDQLSRTVITDPDDIVVWLKQLV